MDSSTQQYKLAENSNISKRGFESYHGMPYDVQPRSPPPRAKIIPVKEHNQVLSKQYLASCFKENHPCHDLVLKRNPPRRIREDLKISFLDEINPYL
uniref:hypothetical protein n=1 Tax=Streptomyces sp. IBSBF 2390 TaxID=2903533 RepID=UPI002FDC1689